MRNFIKQYIPMADMIVKTFGTDCEVVLHDLSDPQHSVVYIANDKITGRKIGDSFDQLVKQVMMSKALKDGYVANYFFRAANGHIIRSSTLLLNNEKNKLEGALCINIDTSRISSQIDYLQTFLPQNEQTEEIEFDKDSIHVEEMVTALIDNILGDIQPVEMSREERIEKTRFMEAKGIFLMKGAIEQVAEKMGINKVTVYSYIDEIRGKR